jgi:hypothetical protein
VLVDGQPHATLPLTSVYSWVYGDYPFNNNPSDGFAHRFFDEVRAEMGNVPEAATVRLVLPPDAADPVTIDLVEVEVVPGPYDRPEGSLSIEDYGAISGDAADDTAAIESAIAAGSETGQVVWIPAGEYQLHQRLNISNVTLRGAGPWHSILTGLSGKGGFRGVGSDIALVDFAIYGDVRYRDDANFDAGLDGPVGAGSLIQNLWIEHTKVGVWTDGTDALITGCRIRDTFADGVNLTAGTRGVLVEHLHVRGTGDDGLAMWSNGPANVGNMYRNNFVALPHLANGIAIYGGQDNAIRNNYVADTVVASAGIAISTRSEFSPEPFSGSTWVENNMLVRTGGHEGNWNADLGALWAFADASAVVGLVVRDLTVVDSTFSGILLSGANPVSGALFENVTVDGASGWGIEVLTTGSATATNLTVLNATLGESSGFEGFTLTQE